MTKLLLPIMMFAVATIFYFYEFLLRVVPGAIFSELMEAFTIDATQLGILSSFYFYSYAVLQLPVGAWIDRLGPRRPLTGAILLCALSTLLFGKTESFELACLARMFIGAGSAFAFICCMKVVALWFPARYFSILAGLTLMIGSLGAVSGEVPVAIALQWVSWRTLMLWFGIVGVVLALLAYLIIRDGEKEDASKKDFEVVSPVGFMHCLRVIMRRPQNWWIALYAFLTTGPTDAFGGMWGVPYLVHAHGFDKAAAAGACSMTFVGLALGSLFIGWLTTRMQSRRRPMWLAAGGATAALTVLIYSPVLTFFWAATLFFLFGFLGVYVLSFVAGSDINEPSYTGTMVGFVNMASMVGSSLLMSGIGVLLDTWRTRGPEDRGVYTQLDYQVGLGILPVCYALCVLFVIPKIQESFPKEA